MNPEKTELEVHMDLGQCYDKNTKEWVPNVNYQGQPIIRCPIVAFLILI